MVRDARQHHFKEEPPEDAERQPGEERATGGDQLAPLERPEEKPKGSSQHQEEQQAYPTADRGISDRDAEPV